MSATTHALLPPGERLVPTGGVEIKGKGLMETYIFDPARDVSVDAGEQPAGEQVKHPIQQPVVAVVQQAQAAYQNELWRQVAGSRGMLSGVVPSTGNSATAAGFGSSFYLDGPDEALTRAAMLRGMPVGHGADKCTSGANSSSAGRNVAAVGVLPPCPEILGCADGCTGLVGDLDTASSNSAGTGTEQQQQADVQGRAQGPQLQRACRQCALVSR